MFVFSGFFVFKVCLKLFHTSASVIRNSRVGGFSVLILLCSYLCQVGLWCLSPFFLSFTVVLVSAWSFQPTMVVLGPWSTPSVCLRYVLGLTFPTARSTPLKITAGESVLCKANGDAILEKWIIAVRRKQQSIQPHVIFYFLLAEDSKEGVFWSPWLPSNEIWNIWGYFCSITLFFWC